MIYLKFVDDWQLADVITHPAPHHADEIFATVMLARALGLNEWSYHLSVYRTRDMDIVQKASERVHDRHWPIICDIGGKYDFVRGMYDHHQADFSFRRDGDKFSLKGVKYATAGLVWKTYGISVAKTYCRGSIKSNPSDVEWQNIARMVDEKLISGIDGFDNGEFEDDQMMSVSSLIQLFNTNEDEFPPVDGHTYDKMKLEDCDFSRACKVADLILERAVMYAVAVETNRKEIEFAIGQLDENDKFIVLNKPYSTWREVILDISAKANKHDLSPEESTISKIAAGLCFCIFPQKGEAGNWCVQAIPPNKNELTMQRLPFPLSWRGLRGADLIRATGVEDAISCHLGGFFALAGSRGGAIELAWKASSYQISA